MKFAMTIIMLMCALVTVPYLFAKGAIFDVRVIEINDCGQQVMIHGYYQSNVSAIIFFALISVVALGLPFMMQNMKKSYKIICFFLSGWFIMGLFYEAMGLFIPELLMKMDDYRMYTKMVFAFTVLIASLQIKQTWKQNTSKN